MSEFALELNNITKRYPLVLANDHISLGVKWGEVLALVGENGAGKSTLMKIVYGLVRPDEGEIFVNGRRVEIHDPADAIALGIGMVHQHFMLVDTLSVLDNVILGMEPKAGPAIDYAAARKRVVELIEELGFDLDPDAIIEDLPVGAQQRVEILKTLYRDAKILILDEPTAVLTPQEVEELFKFLREFAEKGHAIILITHKLDEVMQVSDRVTVIRDGKVVGTVNTPETSVAELARMMVGREVILTVQKKPAEPGEVVLEAEDLRVEGAGHRPRLDGVSFQVHAGEVVGIAGVEGNGQTELVEVITGLRPFKGTLRYNGEAVHPSARKVREWGVSHIPELARNPKLLVAAQPTRGVDIGAIEFIHQNIIEARDQGMAVLLVSADLNEVMSLSDRILVMYEGRIVGEVRPDEVTEEQIGLLMAGLEAAV